MSLDPMPDAATLLRLKAEREARDQRLPYAEPFDRPKAEIEAEAAEDARREKELVAEADRRMRAVGFVVVNFSQPRASKQTPGIPDREYFHPGRGLFVKWEAKTPRGRQSPAQCQYQEWCDACHVPYVVGPPHELYAWCEASGVRVPLT